MKLVYVTISLIYFLCISSVMMNIKNFKTKISRFIFSLSSYAIILVSLCFIKNEIFLDLNLFFSLLQIAFLYFAFEHTKLSSIIYTYFFTYFTNAILVLIIAIATKTSLQNTLWIDFIVNTIANLTYIVLCFTRLKIKIQQVLSWIPIILKRVSILLLFLIMCFLSIALKENFLFNSTRWFSFFQNTLLVIVIFLIFILGLLVCIVLSNSQLKHLTQNYEQQIYAQAEHYRLLAESNFELRRFKHDFQNMSYAMRKSLDEENYAQALSLFDEYSNTLDSFRSSINSFDTGNGIADALLSDKCQKALASNTKIMFQGTIPTNYLSPTDICVILGNTLDNAIEACEKFDDTETKTISVVSNCNSGFLFLSITNPIHEKVKIHNNYISTTKENKTLHGFGLYSLQSVVKKYDGNVELNATDTTFTINIDLSLINRSMEKTPEIISTHKKVGSHI